MNFDILRRLDRTFPEEFFKELLSWKTLIKSPYGNSYYNAVVDWDYKPANSLRISNHWNFIAQSQLHCKTLTEVPNNTHWALGKFNDEFKAYKIIKVIPNSDINIFHTKSVRMSMLQSGYDHAFEQISKQEHLSEKRLRFIKSELELHYLNKYLKILQESK